MNDVSLTTVTRHAAGAVSRRASLVTLSAAGLAAGFAGSRTAGAKKSSSKKAKKKCKKQVGQCTTYVTAACAGQEPSCLDLLACCTPLGSCNVTGFFTCLVTPAP